jgi:thymidine kinase
LLQGKRKFKMESNSSSGNKVGSIEVICGPMFSGKTEELLRRINLVKDKSMLIVKPNADHRYSKTDIVSHPGNSISAIPIMSSQGLLELFKGEEFVFIDELQFFDKQIVTICEELAAKGTIVVAAGLNLDYLGKPFGIMPEMMAKSDIVTKLLANCSVCGEKANFSQRTNHTKKQIVLGAAENYTPLCRNCFNANKN